MIKLNSFLHMFSKLSCHSRSLHSSFYLSEDVRRLLASLKHKYKPQECENILQQGSVSFDLHAMLCKSKHFEPQVEHCPVSRVDIATLNANHPSEDRWNIGVNQVDGAVSSLLFSVSDGHSGTECVDVLNRAGLEYVATSLLDTNKLEYVRQQMRRKDVEMYHIMRRFYPKFYPSLPANLYEDIWRRISVFVEDQLKISDREPINVPRSMEQALLRLDADLSSMAMERGLGDGNKSFLHTGLSGAVSIMGRIYWAQDKATSSSSAISSGAPCAPDIHLASTGDCRAAVFRQPTESSSPAETLQQDVQHQLEGLGLTLPHTAENASEVARILAEHPTEEHVNIIRQQRLLGELAPLRAFGDVRYKWTAEQLAQSAKVLLSPAPMVFVPPHYCTPPYLTAKPDIVRHEISPQDRFLVVATDGMWDVLQVEDVARILGQSSASVPAAKAHNLKTPSEDGGENLATRLVKHALGVVDPISGETDYRRFSTTLALPKDLVRYVRDDITIMVIYLQRK